MGIELKTIFDLISSMIQLVKVIVISMSLFIGKTHFKANLDLWLIHYSALQSQKIRKRFVKISESSSYSWISCFAYLPLFPNCSQWQGNAQKRGQIRQGIIRYSQAAGHSKLSECSHSANIIETVLILPVPVTS